MRCSKRRPEFEKPMMEVELKISQQRQGLMSSPRHESGSRSDGSHSLGTPLLAGGSSTGKMDKNELKELNIVKKEAANKVYHTNGKGNKSKDKEKKNKKSKQQDDENAEKLERLEKVNKLCDRYPACIEKYGGKCKFLHPWLEPKQEIAKTKIKVYQLPVGYYYYKDGNFVYSNVDNDYEVIACDGELVRYGSFTIFGRIFPGGQYLFIKKIYEVVYGRLGILSNNERNYRALDSFLYKLMPEFPPEYIQGMIYAYSYRIQNRCGPSEHKEAIEHTSCTLHLGMVIDIPMEDYNGEIDYQYNSRWRVVSKNGFSFEVQNSLITGYPAFNTYLEQVVTGKNKRQYFRFNPSNPFVCYANSGRNLVAGLKRYLSARDENEEQYVENQFKLFGGFSLQFYLETVSLCGAHYNLWSKSGGSTIESRPVNCLSTEVVHKKEYELDYKTDSKLLLDALLPKKGLYLYYLYVVAKLTQFYGIVWYSIIIYIYTPMYKYYRYTELLEKFVLLPHPKRLLYGRYVDDESTMIEITNNSSAPMSMVKWEFGKYGKVPRLFGSFGPGALVDIVLTIMIKELFREQIDFCEILDEYSSVTKSGIQHFYVKYSDAQNKEKSDLIYFEMMMLQDNSILCVFFSDDGVMIIKLNGRITLVETDISSCDSSHSLPMFGFYRYLSIGLDSVEICDKLLEQCAMATELRNPCKRSEYVRLLPAFMFLYSGSKLTTGMNNLASYFIFYGIYRDVMEHGVDDILSRVSSGARLVGYKVTACVKSNFNSLTFLKRAFNTKVSWLVLGPILRSFGVIDGAPDRHKFGILSVKRFNATSDADRAEILIRTLLDGLVGEPISPVINALRVRCGFVELEEEVTRVDYQQRYGGEEHEWCELFDSIESLKFGDNFRMSILDKIYEVDYGVPAEEYCKYVNSIYVSNVLNVH